jgi:hypothetical protein
MPEGSFSVPEPDPEASSSPPRFQAALPDARNDQKSFQILFQTIRLGKAIRQQRLEFYIRKES